MQNLTGDTTELIKADQLLDMTITEAEKFERDRQSVLDNLMASMVQVATTNGAKEYSASLNPQFNGDLLVKINTDLQELGYTTLISEKEDENVGKFSNLTISWAKQSAQAAVEAAVDSETK